MALETGGCSPSYSAALSIREESPVLGGYKLIISKREGWDFLLSPNFKHRRSCMNLGLK